MAEAVKCPWEQCLEDLGHHLDASTPLFEGCGIIVCGYCKTRPFADSNNGWAERSFCMEVLDARRQGRPIPPEWADWRNGERYAKLWAESQRHEA